MTELSPVVEKFILHWGEMGARWGINRTVAQIHALLYVSARPLNADDITEALGVARSNVSTSLRELQGWGIVKVAHVMGDRRDHFVSLTDVWELFQVIMNERKKREFDPIMAMLRECVAEAEKGGTRDAHVRDRLASLASFFASLSNCYEQMRKLPAATLVDFLSLGAKVRKFLGMKG